MPKAKYNQIYLDLKKAIGEGTYPYGSLMPSENTLIAQYECSRNTVRRALACLSEDGYVQPIHGKGVRIIYQPVEQALFTAGDLRSFRETARCNHWRTDTKVIQFSVLTVNRQIAKMSGFPEGEEIYYILRIRHVNGKPSILEVNMFRKPLVPGLTAEIAEGSVYAYIETELGMAVAASKRTVTVERASPLDGRFLKLDGYNCLAVVTSRTFNAEGVLFEYTQARYQPDHFSFYDTAARKKDR